MAEIKIRVPDALLRRLPKDRKEVEEVVRLGLERLNARRRKKSRGVVDNTFGTLPLRKHGLIEQVIEQTKHGE